MASGMASDDDGDDDLLEAMDAVDAVEERNFERDERLRDEALDFLAMMIVSVHY
jgi:Lhr-like helicase